MDFFVLVILAAVVSVLPLLAIVAIVVVVLKGRKGEPTRGYGSAEARLQELASLHQGGLITPEEYAARRSAIVDSI